MKNLRSIFLILTILCFSQQVFSQLDDKKDFRITGLNQIVIPLNQTITASTDLSPFTDAMPSIFGLVLKADITFTSDNGLVRVILVDRNYSEYLIKESFPLLEEGASASLDDLGEETVSLQGVFPGFLRIEVRDAEVRLKKLTCSSAPDPAIDIQSTRKSRKAAQDDYKIQKLNKVLASKGLMWVAGNTDVSSLSFAGKKKLYGQSTFPAGIEYYSGGVISSGGPLKSATVSLMVEKWDWRNRHGLNWITGIRNQASCGSCWAFAATGATEAQVNLFFNQNTLSLDLSEQDVLSCSGAGTCAGGYPSTALSYISSTGIVDENAFKYTATDQPCSNKSTTPTQLIKIAGRVDFGSSAYPATDDNLKRMIIKYGPLSGGLYDWSHAMTLVGWQVVKAGDVFYYRDPSKNIAWITVPAGSALIGTTVWMFKNSWGSWGDGGYVYVQTATSNIGWTHALLSPVQSVKQSYTVACTDNDHDGYYWWGLGTKPANCPPCPDQSDGDDSNANLGPLDEYGNCIILGAPPVANFSADKVSVNQNSSVTFTDLSTNLPVSWSWTFDGGTPATSTVKNPVITYSTAGTFNVSLTVTNSAGSNTMLKTAYITVVPYVPTYCSSHGMASKEWIASVTLNAIKNTSGSSGIPGYQNFTSFTYTLLRGKSYAVSLAPGFSPRTTNTEAWSVWIDLNQDYDFTDAGEQVFRASKTKNTVSGTIAIPSTALAGTTRMRVSMKRNTLPLPCEVFANGEVEDYTIVIAAGLFGKSGLLDSPEVTLPDIRIYPNPATDKLNVVLDAVSDQARLVVYNLQGQMLISQPVRETSTQVDVSALPAGLYLVVVQNGTSLYREKFMKE